MLGLRQNILSDIGVFTYDFVMHTVRVTLLGPFPVLSVHCE
jgi:hypothetical protein